MLNHEPDRKYNIVTRKREPDFLDSNHNYHTNQQINKVIFANLLHLFYLHLSIYKMEMMLLIVMIMMMMMVNMIMVIGSPSGLFLKLSLYT